MGVNPDIFREYDIRGVVGRDLTLEVRRPFLDPLAELVGLGP